MSLFQGKPMIIHSGGTSRKGGQSQAGSTRLFHIRQSSSQATRAVEVSCLPAHGRVLLSHNARDRFPPLTCPHVFPQVEASASNLNTNDVFVLKSPSALFVWRGVGASDEEMGAAKHVTSFLGGSASQVSEGKEPGGCPLMTNVMYAIQQEKEQIIGLEKSVSCFKEFPLIVLIEVLDFKMKGPDRSNYCMLCLATQLKLFQQVWSDET